MDLHGYPSTSLQICRCTFRYIYIYTSSMCGYPGSNKRLSTTLPITFKNPECHSSQNCPPQNAPPDPVGSQEVTHGSSWLPTGFHFRNSQGTPKYLHYRGALGPRGPPVPGGWGRGPQRREFRGGFGAEVQAKCLNLVGAGRLWRGRSQGLGATRG